MIDPDVLLLIRTLQLMQSELKACQQKQQQQQVAYESIISVLQSDVAALRCKLSDTQDSNRASVDQLRNGLTLQLEKQQQDIDEQLQALQQETTRSVKGLQQEVHSKASSTGTGAHHVLGTAGVHAPKLSFVTSIVACRSCADRSCCRCTEL